MGPKKIEREQITRDGGAVLLQMFMHMIPKQVFGFFYACTLDRIYEAQQSLDPNSSVEWISRSTIHCNKPHGMRLCTDRAISFQKQCSVLKTTCTWMILVIRVRIDSGNSRRLWLSGVFAVVPKEYSGEVLGTFFTSHEMLYHGISAPSKSNLSHILGSTLH